MISIDWLAGFFDGEGCVCILCHQGRHFFINVELTQVDKKIMEDIQAEYGGYLYPKSHKNKNSNQSWALRWTMTLALEFLEKIAPSLKVKKEQVDFVLANKQHLIKRSGKKLSEDEVTKRASIRLHLASLKPYSKILANNQVN